MRSVVYTGPHDGVQIVLPDGTEELVTHGGELETTDEHANALLDQPDNWQPVKKAAAKKEE